MTRVVDAHLHLWDPTRLQYPWLAELPELNRPIGPEALTTGGHEVAAAVFVEAGRADEEAADEVAWIEQVAARWPVIRAVVAHATLERGAGAAADVRRLAAVPLVRGVRRNVQDEAAGFAVADAYVAGVRLLADHGLTADLCVRHHQLPEVTDLVRRVPEVTFVLDHLGKPAVRDALTDPWREHISRLAGLPNVVCKLSGLTTEADWAGWRTEQILPYLRHALAEFGPERCLFGSDWPVATLATAYGRWVDVVVEALAGRPDADHDLVLRGTAARVYRLPPV
jgi:L-fuconolactonase